MSEQLSPKLDDFAAAADTRDAMHAYARVLGDCLKACRGKRKHWWHASLRPSLNGLTTGIVRATADFELELDFRRAELHARSRNDEGFDVKLSGQPAGEIADAVSGFMSANGVGPAELGSFVTADRATTGWQDFSPPQSESMGQVLRSVATAMETFRAGVREETSPIQLWPHHFDLSMIWLPGEKIPGQDPMDEEYSDKQMNFGFAFGDESISEPYFYVTAYPTPDAMAATQLPAGSEWKTDGFNGAVLTYRSLLNASVPSSYLQDFWTRLLAAGQQHMLEKKPEGLVQ
jgi:hypothetical protein